MNNLPTLVDSWYFYEEAAQRGEYGEIVSTEGRISLSKGHEEMAEFFITHLKGKTAVLDAGCGSGFPSLLLAPHVSHLIALDAAPTMCARLNAHVRQLGYRKTMKVVRAEVTVLPFQDGSFDGAVISGTLGSLSQPRLFLKDLHRTMRSKGIAACVAQNFARKVELDKGKPRRWFRMDRGRLSLRTVEYLGKPYRIRDCRYVIKETSTLYPKLAEEHRGESSWEEATQQTPHDLPSDAIAQVLYDEAIQFDPQSLTALFVETGFQERQKDVRHFFGAECLCVVMEREDSKFPEPFRDKSA
jgi:ubiquinone/menaquinone biosynthesis C-methylase UbiE